MDHNLSYLQPLLEPGLSRTSEKRWEKVIAAHKAEDYVGVVHGILDYVDTGLIARTGNADRTMFRVPHGSVILQLQLKEDAFEVRAPFLNIAQSKKIPLLRKTTELNFSPLNLSSIHLREEELFFHYKSPLALCEPFRTYDALREICIYADTYDDEFIRKFGAQWIVQPDIRPFSDALKKQAWDDTRSYIEESMQGIAYFENKRNFNLIWYIITITLLKIEEHIRPQGMLRTEMEKVISFLTENNESVNNKAERGRRYLEKLLDYDPKEFSGDLYTTETFIPYKQRNQLQTIKTDAADIYDQVRRELEQGNQLGAALTLQYHFLSTMYYNEIPRSVYDTMREALLEAGGKPWKDASKALFRGLRNIITLEPESAERHRWRWLRKFYRRK